MHICFVVEGYPIPKNPTMTFVRELVAQLVRRGVKCSVIAPQSLVKALKPKVPLRKRHWVDRIDDTWEIDVYQPYYLTVSNLFPSFARRQLTNAARRAFRKIKEPVDALYGHFWHMGVIASQVESTLPVFVACGESRISVLDDHTPAEVDALLARLKGVVYVGTKVYNESLELGLQKKEYIIAPNGYNPSVFYKADRRECREALGWDPEAFIVSFVGTFNKRKGADRLDEALKALNREMPVKACFIGRGDLVPEGEHVLYAGAVDHAEIVTYLGASDVFVLPTNNEGCCNAIVEALACGLPVISSNQSFNDDIIDGTCSIKIDPMDVEALKAAIRTLRDDTALRERLGAGALKMAEGLRLDTRAQRIEEFIRKQLEK